MSAQRCLLISCNSPTEGVITKLSECTSIVTDSKLHHYSSNLFCSIKKNLEYCKKCIEKRIYSYMKQNINNSRIAKNASWQ